MLLVLGFSTLLLGLSTHFIQRTLKSSCISGNHNPRRAFNLLICILQGFQPASLVYCRSFSTYINGVPSASPCSSDDLGGATLLLHSVLLGVAHLHEYVAG
jgi:hypothetical protein